MLRLFDLCTICVCFGNYDVMNACVYGDIIHTYFPYRSTIKYMINDISSNTLCVYVCVCELCVCVHKRNSVEAVGNFYGDFLISQNSRRNHVKDTTFPYNLNGIFYFFMRDRIRSRENTIILLINRTIIFPDNGTQYWICAYHHTQWY